MTLQYDSKLSASDIKNIIAANKNHFTQYDFIRHTKYYMYFIFYILLHYMFFMAHKVFYIFMIISFYKSVRICLFERLFQGFTYNLFMVKVKSEITFHVNYCHSHNGSWLIICKKIYYHEKS